MSQEVEGLGPRGSAEFYIPLVKEYAEKLSAICERSAELLKARAAYGSGATNTLYPEAARLIEQFDCLRPDVEKLIRRTATILDHARIGPDLELALGLRQEELESNFRLMPAILGMLETSFGSKQVRAIIDKTRVKVVN